MSDLITSLRALAAARHDDLSIAVDAVIEIERLRAEIERLREVLKIVRINGPDSNGLVWWSFSREGGVRVSFVLGHKEKMLSQAFLEFEQIRRKALEGKP